MRFVAFGNLRTFRINSLTFGLSDPVSIMSPWHQQPDATRMRWSAFWIGNWA